MTEEGTNCTACGNPMLVRTAEKYGGQCVPCAKGYRESIGQARLVYEEKKRRENDPDVLFWRSFCSRVDNPALGFNSLPGPEKLYFAVCLLAGEIYNGGFEQYFTNSYADYFDYALRGLEKTGDELGYELALKAKRLLFDGKDVPMREERQEFFETTKILDRPEISKTLDDLDAAFVKNYEDGLSIKLTKFALENCFWEEA